MIVKFFLFIAGAFVLFSCGKETSENTESENILENLSVTVDTVMIDSKGKLFDLRRGPHSSSVSEVGKYLYLFNSHTLQIQQINLDELRWEKDFDFEVEGPNGITDMVLDTKTLGDGTFLISAYRRLGIFSEDGTKMKDLSISSLPIQSDLVDLEYQIILSNDLKTIFSLPGDRHEGTVSFAKINLETLEIENFQIPEMDWIFDIKVSVDGRVVLQEEMYLLQTNNQILALSPSTSSFYRYNLETDSLSFHSFEHKLSLTKTDVQLKAQVESDEEYSEEFNRFFMAFNFGPILWDPSRQHYFRFGRKPIERDERQEMISSQVYMYIYDRDFKLIGEAFLPELSQHPRDFFFKDGKLWSYVNVDDELGFAVMDFKF